MSTASCCKTPFQKQKKVDLALWEHQIPGVRTSLACSCLRLFGCRVLTPNYWTIAGNVNFNFTGLESQGAFTDFEWSVGQYPGVADTIPIQSRADSTQRFVSYQTGLLVSFVTWATCKQPWLDTKIGSIYFLIKIEQLQLVRKSSRRGYLGLDWANLRLHNVVCKNYKESVFCSDRATKLAIPLQTTKSPGASA